MERLSKYEPQEVSIADAEESKSSVLQVIRDPLNSREQSGSPAMEDKQPQSLVLEEPPLLADLSFGLEPPHMHM